MTIEEYNSERAEIGRKFASVTRRVNARSIRFMREIKFVSDSMSAARIQANVMALNGEHDKAVRLLWNNLYESMEQLYIVGLDVDAIM